MRRQNGSRVRRDRTLGRLVVNVVGSMSTNTGVRPATRAISGTTQNVSAGTMISEPAGRSSAFRMK